MYRKVFRLLKRVVPGRVAFSLKCIGTAIIAPIKFSTSTGHFKSSILARSVSRSNAPLPWYTYPAIDFLNQRVYNGKKVLEFGGGQSSIYWGQKSESVLTFEADEKWWQRLTSTVPSNVKVVKVNKYPKEECLKSIRNTLSVQPGKFDVIIIDGLWREALVEISVEYLNKGGAILCDNTNNNGYGMHLKFPSGFSRIDFYGFVPAVVSRSCTSLFFSNECFLLDNSFDIPDIEFQ